MRIPTYLGLLLSMAALHQVQAEPELEFFEQKIRPLLADQCYSCHSVGAEKLKAGLYLDHTDFIKEGGDNGPAIVAGKPDESLLIEAVRYKNVDLQMPPRQMLSAQQIKDVETWVGMGAPWPEEPHPTSEKNNREIFDWKQRKQDHWCWQPVKKVDPPTLKDEALTSHPIDQFIVAKLEAKGLSPAPETDRRTWIRRVSYDLIGLPPSVEEVDAFLSDNSSTAYETVVQRLLDSKHYGERWGRHWLDLVRYAESLGHEFDFTLPHAHKYRDYVIRAFNANIPYDQLVKEHIAGDLFAKPRIHPERQSNESVIGTGFWFLHEAVHAPTDVRKDEADRIDNQIDVFSKAFQSLTVACSRCHDHKFDAIPTQDYYALAGFLQSSRMNQAQLDPHGKIRAGIEAVNAQRAKVTASITPELVARYLKASDLVLHPEKAKDVVEKDLLEPSKTEEATFVPDRIFEGFGASGYDAWTKKGEAFETTSNATDEKKGDRPQGVVGVGFATSKTANDRAQGSLSSRPFRIERPFINFLCGGRNDKKNTAVQLLVDGAAVRTSTGPGWAGKNRLVDRSWDVRDLIGKEAVIYIADNSRGPTGFIQVDHIVFSDKPSTTVDGAGIASSSEGRTRLESITSSMDLSLPVLEDFMNRLAESSVNRSSHPLHFWKRFLDADDARREMQLARSPKIIEPDELKPHNILLADFSGSTPPSEQGWFTVGEAFKRSANSAEISSRLEGTLRSPTFLHDRDVWVLVRGKKILIRLIIDGYMMEASNSLLFGGTRISNLDTKDEWQWVKLGSTKHHGHTAFLSIEDVGDAVVEVARVEMGARPPVPLSQMVAAAVSETISPNLFADAFAKAMIQHETSILVDLKFADQALLAELDRLEATIPTADRVIAIEDGTGENESIFIRGGHENLGPVAPRQYLVAIAGEAQSQLNEKDGSGRLRLAESMFAPDNPLTSRVAVNRIWHHLFGRGIVPTVDDFGVMGQFPSHPELLDWLATDFQKSGWNTKRMIKQLVLSKTYRMSSAPADPKAEEADPNNQLLHRMPIRRLQAEAIRDGILAVSGRLDPKMEGPSVPVHLTSFQQGRGRPGSGPLDGNGRRSVYLGIRRNFVSSFLGAYDFPTPFSTMGRRTVSNVPAQALVLMNDPFVVAEAKRWSQKLHASEGDLSAKVQRAFEEGFARPPNEKEAAMSMAFLVRQATLKNKPADSAEVLADFCHVLFNKKEWIYLN